MHPIVESHAYMHLHTSADTSHDKENLPPAYLPKLRQSSHSFLHLSRSSSHDLPSSSPTRQTSASLRVFSNLTSIPPTNIEEESDDREPLPASSTPDLSSDSPISVTSDNSTSNRGSNSSFDSDGSSSPTDIGSDFAAASQETVAFDGYGPCDDDFSELLYERLLDVFLEREREQEREWEQKPNSLRYHRHSPDISPTRQANSDEAYMRTQDSEDSTSETETDSKPGIYEVYDDFVTYDTSADPANYRQQDCTYETDLFASIKSPPFWTGSSASTTSSADSNNPASQTLPDVYTHPVAPNIRNATPGPRADSQPTSSLSQHPSYSSCSDYSTTSTTPAATRRHPHYHRPSSTSNGSGSDEYDSDAESLDTPPIGQPQASTGRKRPREPSYSHDAAERRRTPPYLR